MSHTLEMLRAGALAGVTRLNLRGGLTTFPREIFDLAETLEILDLSGNQLTALPDDLARLTKLKVLFCSDNQFTALPPVLGACLNLSMVGFKANRLHTVSAAALPPQLRWLILTDNQISALPAELGNRPALQKLMLAGNRLRTLPPELGQCTSLELLRISANELDALPEWVFTLPRLAWLAYAGNPFCAAREQAALASEHIGSIAWSALRIHQQLGEGASGVIYRADYQPDHRSDHRSDHRPGDAAPVQALAVKLFKGAVTSDGWPRSEMAACISAGRHANLIPIQHKVSGHPGGAAGLTMPLIDPEYRNLAGPPSFDSCTRDVYPAGTRMTLAEVIGLTHGIAAAARHLHQHGILHGDLYGHNILYAGHGRALLGDFGAAALLVADAPHAAALERIEVRAFGCLLEELVALCDPLMPAGAALSTLTTLTLACLQPDVGQRPSFEHIVQTLAALPNG